MVQEVSENRQLSRKQKPNAQKKQQHHRTPVDSRASACMLGTWSSRDVGIHNKWTHCLSGTERHKKIVRGVSGPRDDCSNSELLVPRVSEDNISDKSR